MDNLRNAVCLSIVLMFARPTAGAPWVKQSFTPPLAVTAVETVCIVISLYGKSEESAGRTQIQASEGSQTNSTSEQRGV
jgi:hypothetical protein